MVGTFCATCTVPVMFFFIAVSVLVFNCFFILFIAVSVVIFCLTMFHSDKKNQVVTQACVQMHPTHHGLQNGRAFK